MVRFGIDVFFCLLAWKPSVEKDPIHIAHIQKTAAHYLFAHVRRFRLSSYVRYFIAAVKSKDVHVGSLWRIVRNQARSRSTRRYYANDSP